MNVQMRVHILRTFITYLLVHIHQKKKIAPKIAVKIVSVNGPLYNQIFLVSSKHTKTTLRSTYRDVVSVLHLNAEFSR
jgi:hypothetical protein